MSVASWMKLTKKPAAEEDRDRFAQCVLPHLNAAYNLARWLTRNPHDAEDIVQESYLRALQFFGGFQLGGNSRVWLLQIVRNTWRTWMRKNHPRELVREDENIDNAAASALDPETALVREANSELVRQAIEELSPAYREVLILREFEELSYKEISSIVDAPLGTVMSRLSRAREDLHMRLSNLVRETKR